MEVSSANSASVASTQRAMRTEQTQQVQQRQADRQQTENKAANAAPPTPVINTQGQTTGRLLNVTAWRLTLDAWRDDFTMVAIAATNSATPSLQASLSQTRLQQARREADQAEAKAQNLRAQANTAESEAQRSQGRVRELSSSSAPTDPTYQVKRTPNIVQLQAASNPYSAQNTQGQATGRIINLRAWGKPSKPRDY